MSEKPGPNTNATIQICQVGNGFIVRPDQGWIDQDDNRRMWAGRTTEYLVFRSMAELQEFVAEHFSHRSKVTNPDR